MKKTTKENIKVISMRGGGIPNILYANPVIELYKQNQLLNDYLKPDALIGSSSGGVVLLFYMALEAGIIAPEQIDLMIKELSKTNFTSVKSILKGYLWDIEKWIKFFEKYFPNMTLKELEKKSGMKIFLQFSHVEGDSKEFSPVILSSDGNLYESRSVQSLTHYPKERMYLPYILADLLRFHTFLIPGLVIKEKIALVDGDFAPTFGVDFIKDYYKGSEVNIFPVSLGVDQRLYVKVFLRNGIMGRIRPGNRKFDGYNDLRYFTQKGITPYSRSELVSRYSPVFIPTAYKVMQIGQSITGDFLSQLKKCFYPIKLQES